MTTIVLWRSLLCVSCVLLAVSAGAANVVVNSNADPGTAGDAQCTLREALTNANLDGDLSSGDCAAGAGTDAITFALPAGTVILLGAAFNDVLEITSSLTLTGPGADQLAVDGGVTGGVFEIEGAAAAVTIEGLTIRGGSRTQGGGVNNSGALTLRRVAVRDNHAADDGGGIFNTGILVVADSTISGNGEVEVGGGIANYGTLTLVNSTVSGNGTRGPSAGGGVFNGAAGTVRIFNSTITANVSEQTLPAFESRGGGIENRGSAFITNSLIAGNTATGFPENADCSGVIVSGGYNLVGAGCPNAAPGDQSIAPGDVPTYLAPLADNGGPTLTHALRDVPANPAVDSGDPAGCRDESGTLLTTDQRGARRPSAARCDIGAFELQQLFRFHWYPLIKNPPHLNPWPAGVPMIVSFSLGGNRGLSIFESGAPASRRVDCSTRTPLGSFEPTVSVPGTSLQYVAVTDSYVYLWRTKIQWRNTCRELSLGLTDGSTQRAFVAFK